jgi:exopolysaccharide biosynthesis protein YbjH
MRMVSAGLFVLLLAAAGPAFAGSETEPEERPVTEARVPSFFGPTGLFLAPSAYVQRTGEVSPHVYATSDFVGGGVVGGIADRFEVGVSIFDLDNGFKHGKKHHGGDDDDLTFLPHGKFNFLSETDSRPAVSVGALDWLGELDDDPSWYLVASKYFTRHETDQDFALKGHVGFGGGIYGEEPFGGAELFWGQHISAMAEYVDGDVNLGGRFYYNGFAATIGWFDFDEVGGGVSYSFQF